MKTRKLVTPAKFCNSCPKTKGEAYSVLMFLCLKNQRRGKFCSYVLMSKKPKARHILFLCSYV